MEEELLTKKVLALKLKISSRSIGVYEKIGLPYLKIGNLHRYLYSDCIRWMESKGKGGDKHESNR